jgi:hypothetical protein
MFAQAILPGQRARTSQEKAFAGSIEHNPSVNVCQFGNQLAN